MVVEIPNRFLFFITTLFIEIIVFVSIWSQYLWIYHTFFSKLPEAEVQTYLLSVGVSVLAISLWYFITHNSYFRSIFIGNYELDINLSVINKLVFFFILVFPLIFAKFIFPSPQIQKDLTDLSFGNAVSDFNYIFYYIMLAGCLIYLWLVYGSSRAFIEIKNIGLFNFLFYVVSAIIIILLTFHVGYLSIYDISSYAGPINDVLLGRPLLTFHSLYGFLSIGFLAGIFRFIHLSLLNFTILTGILVSIGFIGIFIIALILYKKRSFALLTTLFAIFINWIVNFGSRNTLPQTTVLRFGIWIPLAFVIYWGRRTRSSSSRISFYILEQFIVAIGFFWSFDVGMYILMAYIMFLWFTSFKVNIQETLKAFFPKIWITIGAILGVFFLINFIYITIIGINPQWKYFAGTSFDYLSTFWLVPMPKTVIPWLALSPSWLVISYWLFGKRFKVSFDNNAQVIMLLFIACYGTIQFIYMMGRSTLNALHALAIPFVLCFFFLTETILNKAREAGKQVLFLSILLFSFMVSYLFYFSFYQGLFNLKRENILTTIETIRHPQGTEEEFFGSTVAELNKKYGNVIKKDGIALISIYDTWYLVMLHQINQVGSNNLFDYYIPDKVTSLIKTIHQKRFHYLFVDHEKVQHFGQVSWIFNKVGANYAFKETLGNLDVYELVN